MFKNKSIICCLFFIVIYLSGCWDKKEEILIEPAGRLNYTIEIDKVNYLWKWNYYKYNSDTLLVKIIIKDEVKELGERIFEYNENDQVTTETLSGPYLGYMVTYYLYNENGKLIESIHPSYKYFYDSLDRLIEKRIVKSNLLFKYEYDSLLTDRVKYEKYYEESNEGLNLVYSAEYKYDEMDNLYEKYLESESWMYGSGILESLEYNSKNQLEKRSIYNRKIPPYFQTEISYFYF